MDPSLFIFQIIVLILSVVVHEVSHGVVANALGDPTAKLAGRLTLNPAKHLDFFGSFLLPLLMWIFSGGRMIFGYAKPVPYNPWNLRNPALGGGLIGAAGPLSNLALALLFSVPVRFADFAGGALGELVPLFSVIIFINLLLALFNLIPIPPLDGSKVLFAFFPPRWEGVKIWLEQYGFFLLLLLLFSGLPWLFPLVASLFRLLTGIPI